MYSRVHKGVLELFDKYDGDFSLLYERWAPEADRQNFSAERLQVLSQYVSQLTFSRVVSLSDSFSVNVQADITLLESFIEADVIQIIRDRIPAAP